MSEFVKIEVPAEPKIVQEFIQKNQNKYTEAYNRIKKSIARETASLSIYNSYGRDLRQAGSILKEPRKIRLKFNAYHAKKGNIHGSLWEIPDIVGFTVVVAYPSEISLVCKVIDDLIDSGVYDASESVSASDATGNERAKKVIETKHGRALVSNGYFACHYNIRERGVNKDKAPICEIQIKTILHDAWGAKTHDLTYKAAGQIDRSLVDSFELLGDSLAKLDQQSDLVRQSINKQLSTRLKKKMAIITFERISHLGSAVDASNLLSAEKSALLAASAALDEKEVDRLARCCISEFEKGNPKSGATCLFFLGHLCKADRYIDQGWEALTSWENSLYDPSEQARAAATFGLMYFNSGDSERAIEETKRAVSLISSVSEKSITQDKRQIFLRRKQSFYSSLSYYFAEVIGSDVGEKIDAANEAKRYLDLTLKIRRRVKDCPNSALDNAKILKKALCSTTQSFSNFSCLDNELFVLAQLAKTVPELQSIMRSMQVLKENPPLGFEEGAGLFFDFHDYCARTKLMEIERG
jgi:ppGpp synthetase/RelA/SpoT-type nucleotidyltranferase